MEMSYGVRCLSAKAFFLVLLATLVVACDIQEGETRTIVHALNAELTIDEEADPVWDRGQVVGAAFGDRDSLRLRVAAQSDVVVALGIETSSNELRVTLNGQSLRREVFSDGEISGFVASLTAGDLVEVKTEASLASGVLLMAPPGESPLHEARSDVAHARAEHALVFVPWLAQWIAKTVAKGISCAAVRQSLVSQGLHCPTKPWYVPNPACLWEATTCGYGAQ